MKAFKLYVACFVLFATTIAAKAQTENAAPAKLSIGDMAPAFTLTDLNGKAVSLADYKGKTVVLDFWATWCGPCKASFPGMQVVVNKYKGNSNVVFLFIDVSERVPNYKDEISNYLTNSGYTFYTLAEPKNADGTKKKILLDYDVPGIPTKVVIDKAGYVRYKKVGFNPGMTPEELASEVSDMIEIAAKSDKEQRKTK